MSKSPSGIHEILEFEAGEVVMPQGHLAQGLFILLDGRLEVIYDNIKVADIAQKGAFVGEIATLLGGRRIATVKAATKCRMMRIKQVTEYLESNPSSALLIAQTLAARIMEMNKKITRLDRLVREWLEAGTEAVAKDDINALRDAIEDMQQVMVREMGSG